MSQDITYYDQVFNVPQIPLHIKKDPLSMQQ
jgi:hypothetical protein